MWIITIPRILLGKSYNGIPCARGLIFGRKKYQQAFWRRCRGNNWRKTLLGNNWRKNFNINFDIC